MPKSSENLREFPKISETLQSRYWGTIKLKNIYLWEFWKIVGNLRKLLENFETAQKCFQCFYDFLKFSEDLRKSSEVFGNFRKFSENFGNGSKVIFRCFYDFFKFSENLRKSSACNYVTECNTNSSIPPNFHNQSTVCPGEIVDTWQSQTITLSEL